MKYVIDSSLGVKWVIPEVDSAKALRLCDDYRIGVIELLAPDFYPARSPIPSPEPNDKRVSPRQRGPSPCATPSPACPNWRMCCHSCRVRHLSRLPGTRTPFLASPPCDSHASIQSGRHRA